MECGRAEVSKLPEMTGAQPAWRDSLSRVGLLWQQEQRGLRGLSHKGIPHILWETTPSLPCPVWTPQQTAPRMFPQTHVSCWHGPHPLPALASPCWRKPSGRKPQQAFCRPGRCPFWSLFLWGNWERKARCEWNGSLWAENKREGRQSDWKLAFLLNILQLQRAEATGKDQKTHGVLDEVLELDRIPILNQLSSCWKGDLWDYS